MRFNSHYWICSLIIFYAINLHGQQKSQADSNTHVPWIEVKGSASISSDFYEHSANPSLSQVGRRPSALYRLIFAPTITIAGVLVLPLSVNITFPETNTTTPSISAPTIMEYFTNPANALGLSGFSPKIGWAQFHLGSHTPKLSELSGGDLQLFGLGIDIKPGNLHFKASHGISQRAVEPDVLRGGKGAYRRNMSMGRIAYGNPDSISLGLNFVHAKDDDKSLKNSTISIIPAHPLSDDSTIVIPADTLRLRAEEGFIASIDTKLLFTDGIIFSAEGAMSAFTANQSSALIEDVNNPLRGLYPTTSSTRFDGAGSANLSFQFTSWTLALSALYMGSGFQPIGNPFVQSDRLDLKVSPSFNLFEGDFTINGTIGKRINNLSETKGEQLNQMIANGQLSIRFSDVISLACTYSNFGIRNNRQNVFDSARIQNVSESFSIDPMFTFTAFDMMHTITTSFGMDRFDDFNIVSGLESSNDTRSAIASYIGIFNNIPLTIGANGSYLENSLFAGTLQVMTIGINASYRLFEGSLNPSVAITKTSSGFVINPADEALFMKVGVRGKINKNFSVTGNYAINDYHYGSGSSRGNSFSEQIIQIAMALTF